jgi:phosphoglycolate phosphatase-like HAD superfamily hydrolase
MTTIIIARDGQQDFHVKLQSADSYVFKSLIDALKNFVSPVYRRYEPATRKWVVGEPATESFRSWLSYARATFGAQVQWIGETYEDPEAEWTPPPPRPKPVDPYVTLHLLPSAPPEVVKAAYRALAVLNHPDKGGDGERMKVINDAYRRLAA